MLELDERGRAFSGYKRTPISGFATLKVNDEFSLIVYEVNSGFCSMVLSCKDWLMVFKSNSGIMSDIKRKNKNGVYYTDFTRLNWVSLGLSLTEVMENFKKRIEGFK